MVHGVTKSRTRLNDFPFTFHFHALEKEMATHSSTLAWRIPGTGEPSGLPSMGSHRVRKINIVFLHIYMESRKMVVQNLFTGQQWRKATFPGGSDGKASAYNAGDLGSIPGSG